jgi:hypothetical protein
VAVHATAGVLPAPRVPADLAAPASLAATDEQGAASLIVIGLVERERSLDAQPGSPQGPDKTAPPAAVCVVTPARMTATISSTFVGGSAR